MKIVLLVHDLFMSIGHSNAIIEKLNNLPNSKVDELICICYSFEEKEKLFPLLKDRTTYVKIPFGGLKPFLLKAIFFQIYSWFLILFKYRKNYKKISIGVASLWSDVVDLQFVHRHFENYFFDYKKLSGIALKYKKVLFKFYRFSEWVSFSKSKKYLALSQFVKDYMVDVFKIPEQNINLAYSSVNLQRFYYLDKNKKSLLNKLIQEYPELSRIDLEKTIYLFVGAFERKGLHTVLEKITFLDSPQLIIIGQAESNSNIEFPSNVTCIHIPFTKKLNQFYNLADHFLFPTIYEPYGLVLLEAFACGMYISTNIDNVGASEILKSQENVYLYQNQEHFQIQDTTPLTLIERQEICKKRTELINEISWKKAGEKLYETLTL